MLFALLFVSGCVSTGNREIADWEFTYPGGKLKAVTFSYDDGVIEDRELIKIFDKYNIKATFNVSLGKAVKKPERFIQPKEMKELYKNHEIASHGYLHRTMTLLGKSLTSEIADNQKAIAEVLGNPPPGFAYPYGRHTSKKAPTRIYEALAKHGLRYARTCQRKADFDLPSNWLAWSPNNHHNAGLAICKRYKEFKSDKMSVCYIWGHSYEFDRHGKKSWFIIENICKLIANQPDIWYATNGEIALYVQACEAAAKASKFPEMVNPTDLTLYLTVDGKAVTLPPKSTVNLNK